MSFTNEEYMRTVYDACDAIFDWNEYGCRDLSEMFDDDYDDAMRNNKPYNTPAELADSLMIKGILFDGIYASTISDVAIETMRNILEYAQEENDVWCYSSEEQLDAFDKVASFVSLLGRI